MILRFKLGWRWSIKITPFEFRVWWRKSVGGARKVIFWDFGGLPHRFILFAVAQEGMRFRGFIGWSWRKKGSIDPWSKRELASPYLCLQLLGRWFEPLKERFA